MEKLLYIVGPTATGKSDFAWQVADFLWQTHGVATDVISADSRQVYRGLEIVSGVDLPVTAQLAVDHFRVGEHRLWGVAQLSLQAEWSVAHFNQLVRQVTRQSWSEHRLPMIVGGTGLYSQLALTSDPQLVVPPDPTLRAKAELLELAELQAWVQSTAPERWAGMNASDQANPRRLVRALEIAAQPLQPPLPDDTPINVNELVLGLSLPIEEIVAKITARVATRWSEGAVQEVSRLVAEAESVGNVPAFSSTGVKQILAYLADQATAEEAQQAWITAERQYAKRQLTWWKKREKVQWVDIQQPDWQQAALARIESWYRTD